MSVNPVERLNYCIQCVKNIDTCKPLERTEEGVHTAINCLEELRDWCEEIDLAVGMWIPYNLILSLFLVNVCLHSGKTSR